MTAALALLTVFGRAREPTPRAWPWFPLVGAGIGALLGGIWWLADEAFPALVAAVLVVVADLAVTGMLHFDGLADSADGLLCHATTVERLRIMRAPDVGAFGVIAVEVALLARVAALAAQPVRIGLLVALWCTSRAVVAATPAIVPYARDEGIVSPLLTRPASAWVVAALAPAGVVAALTAGAARGVLAVVAVVVGAFGVAELGKRRIGGFTGDVLGAAIVVGETAGMLVAAARW
jgi:adenosylcobinamide-GDP ribazoletransferase